MVRAVMRWGLGDRGRSRVAGIIVAADMGDRADWGRDIGRPGRCGADEQKMVRRRGERLDAEGASERAAFQLRRGRSIGIGRRKIMAGDAEDVAEGVQLRGQWRRRCDHGRRERLQKQGQARRKSDPDSPMSHAIVQANRPLAELLALKVDPGKMHFAAAAS
jgi:hypothetical protein